MNLKGNISKLPVDFYPISASDIVRHLQDQLGIPVKADFSVWDNRSPWEKPENRGSSYVIMRAIFRPQDVVVPNQAQGYMERLVQASGAGITYQKDIIETLQKFMFPQDMAKVQHMPEELQRLARMGIYGDERLGELIRRPTMFYEPTVNTYGCYLRPERIIYDMFIDLDAAEPNTMAGKVSIVKLEDSEQGDAIKWGVLLWHGAGQTFGNYGVTIDDVFQQKIPR